jgi:predicted DCC family thiol-disulfide oxidoreductase YuxK
VAVSFLASDQSLTGATEAETTDIDPETTVMSWVLFFDGDCAFCNRSVTLVARLDKQARISFAPLQGKLAQEKSFTKYATSAGGTMVVLRESDGEAFIYSDGWIELARALGGGWKFFTIARFIPKFFRDAVYRGFARNRYRFMGKADACALPSPELLKRLRE